MIKIAAPASSKWYGPTPGCFKKAFLQLRPEGLPARGRWWGARARSGLSGKIDAGSSASQPRPRPVSGKA